MEVIELYKLIKEFYGYKCRMIGINTESNQIECFLYDSFIMKCYIDNRSESFTAGIDMGGEILTDLLGRQCSSANNIKAIQECLRIIDDYCRLRLPDKYLDAYDEVYLSS
ncbi:MAG: hypothetical protein J1E62_07140 [Lachnospiraceae bacterium]|nr:hypothetical protein [Lachnospiraceae bacterium]